SFDEPECELVEVFRDRVAHGVCWDESHAELPEPIGPRCGGTKRRVVIVVTGIGFGGGEELADHTGVGAAESDGEFGVGGAVLEFVPSVEFYEGDGGGVAELACQVSEMRGDDSAAVADRGEVLVALSGRLITGTERRTERAECAGVDANLEVGRVPAPQLRPGGLAVLGQSKVGFGGVDELVAHVG